MDKKRIIFVGSFVRPGQIDNIGGVMFACQTIVDSNISDHVNWLYIDSTSPTVSNNHFVIRLFRAFKRIIKFILKLLFGKADAVLIFCVDGFSFYEKGLMVWLGKWFGKKIVLSTRAGKIEEDLQKSFFRAYFKTVVKSCDALICQSEYWQTLFKRYLEQNEHSKLRVIQNGIDVSLYHENPSLTEDKITILFMAWLVKEKGIWELLEAFHRLVKLYPQTQLLIAGKGPEWEEIQLFILKHNLQSQIRLKGWVKEKEKTSLFSEADIFVLPSWYEGLPNVLLEAMASSKACIATRVGAIPDVIRDEKNGILIDKQNEEQLYQALCALTHNRETRLQLGRMARAHVLENNNIGSYVQKINQLLEELI